VPDLAGWRRERLPADFMEGAAATLAPDWCCEVLSASTEEIDRGRKLDVYRREGVAHVWLVSPTLRSVQVLRRQDLGWLLVATLRGGAVVRVEPFDALELDLAGLWAPQRRSPPASEALAFFPRTALHIQVGRVSCALPPRRSPRCVRRRWGGGFTVLHLGVRRYRARPTQEAALLAAAWVAEDLATTRAAQTASAWAAWPGGRAAPHGPWPRAPRRASSWRTARTPAPFASCLPRGSRAPASRGSAQATRRCGIERKRPASTSTDSTRSWSTPTRPRPHGFLGVVDHGESL